MDTFVSAVEPGYANQELGFARFTEFVCNVQARCDTGQFKVSVPPLTEKAYLAPVR